MAHRAQSVCGRPGSGRPGGEAQCGWNTPSFGALLGLERAAARAKTCFCQQKPHFTDTQPKAVMEGRPEDCAPLLQRVAARVFSLAGSGLK